ncbi:MAG: hypothetical protein NZ701_01320, partial [Roseiflexus sp.]|nr:hypothetical protein [Roseiflexus sp.]
GYWLVCCWTVTTPTIVGAAAAAGAVQAAGAAAVVVAAIGAAVDAAAVVGAAAGAAAAVGVADAVAAAGNDVPDKQDNTTVVLSKAAAVTLDYKNRRL